MSRTRYFCILIAFQGNTDKLGELTPTQARPAVVNMKNTVGFHRCYLLILYLSLRGTLPAVSEERGKRFTLSRKTWLERRSEMAN